MVESPGDETKRRMDSNSQKRIDGIDAMQLLPRHRYMLEKVDAAFGIYNENVTEAMFLQEGVIDQVRRSEVCACSTHVRVRCTTQTTSRSIHTRAGLSC